jgi:hypothetical protein
MPIEQAGMLMGAFVLALVTIVVVVVLWRGMEVARTKLAADKDRQYRRLAEASAEFQEQIATEQRRTREAVEEIRTRLAAVEKLLREVG